MKIVQITDTHIEKPGRLILDRFDPSARLIQAIEVINRMDPAPDLVLHTGDIAAHGVPERYEDFRLIANNLNVPLALLPGNHDDRQAMKEAFGGTDWLPTTGGFLHHVIEGYPVE